MPIDSGPPVRRRSNNLAQGVLDALTQRILLGQLKPGEKLPSESTIVLEHGVSRTVVREALSKLQASGLVETRHGIGTFVLGLGDGAAFRIAPDQLSTLNEVIAVLELRIGVETETAALAALRRTDDDLARMRSALDAFVAATEAGRDAVGADFQFHLEIARATRNQRFADLMATLGATIIPRARLGGPHGDEQAAFLRRVHAEHDSIYDAIARQDPDGARAAMRTHLANSRERRRRSADLPQG